VRILVIIGAVLVMLSWAFCARAGRLERVRTEAAIAATGEATPMLTEHTPDPRFEPTLEEEELRALGGGLAFIVVVGLVCIVAPYAPRLLPWYGLDPPADDGLTVVRLEKRSRGSGT
jgi:hypothetical protein